MLLVSPGFHEAWYWFYIISMFLSSWVLHFNTLSGDKITAILHFQIHSFNENCCIVIQISLKFVLKGQINNNQATENRLQTNICVARPGWVNKLYIINEWYIFYIYVKLFYDGNNSLCILWTPMWRIVGVKASYIPNWVILFKCLLLKLITNRTAKY